MRRALPIAILIVAQSVQAAERRRSGVRASQDGRRPEDTESHDQYTDLEGQRRLEDEPAEEPCASIAEIAGATEDFSTLASAVVAAGIGPALSGDGSFTVFAPPNSAFEELFTPELAQKYLNPIWLPQLQDLLLYHALGSEVFSTDLADGAEVDTLNFSGDSITVNLDPPRLNDDSIILVREGLVDIKACNGVIHGVSKVLLPTSATNDIVDIGMASEDFSTLVAAVEASGLVETLKGEGPFTLFAPTNDAFAALPEGTVEALLLPENLDTLKSILTYHVVGANAISTQLTSGPLATVNGADVDVTVSDDGAVRVNTADVIQANVIASNGIIHVIDAVLLPPEEPEDPTTALPLTTEAPALTTEALTTEVPVTEALTTEAPTTEVPVTEAPMTEPAAPEEEEAPEEPAGWTGGDAMLGGSTGKAKSTKAKCKKVKSPKYSKTTTWTGTDDSRRRLDTDDWAPAEPAPEGPAPGKSGKPKGSSDEVECEEEYVHPMAKVTKEWTSGKSGKTKQAKAHYEIDAKAEKITSAKGSPSGGKSGKTPSEAAGSTDDAWNSGS